MSLKIRQGATILRQRLSSGNGMIWRKVARDDGLPHHRESVVAPSGQLAEPGFRPNDEETGRNYFRFADHPEIGQTSQYKRVYRY